MATAYSALMQIVLIAEETPDVTVDPGATGGLAVKVENANGGRRWSDGTGDGKIGRDYKRIRTIGAGGTDSYNTLAAGSLLTPNGAAIDLDELKGLVLKVTSGQIQLAAPAANFLGIFSDATDVINLNATGGLKCIALDFGSDGLDVTVNSTFDIIETSGAAGAVYELSFVGAE